MKRDLYYYGEPWMAGLCKEYRVTGGVTKDAATDSYNFSVYDPATEYKFEHKVDTLYASSVKDHSYLSESIVKLLAEKIKHVRKKRDLDPMTGERILDKYMTPGWDTLTWKPPSISKEQMAEIKSIAAKANADAKAKEEANVKTRSGLKNYGKY